MTTRTDHNQTFDAEGNLVAEEVVEVDITAEVNERTIRVQVEAHMTDLAAITGSSGTLTGAQLSNAVRVLARGQRRLIRLTLGLLDGTD